MFDWSYWLELFGERAYQLHIRRPGPGERLTMEERERIRDSLATFVDVFTPMLGADGRPRADLFGPDSLHMNSTGYALWRSVLGPVLEARAR